MRRCLVLVIVNLLRCAGAYANIKWAKFPAANLVIVPRGTVGMLAIGHESHGVPSEMMPRFTINADSTIASEDTKWCIEADGSRRGAAVYMDQCTGKPSQRWSWIPDGNGRTMIQQKDTNMCLDVLDKGGLTGAPIVLWECRNTVSESWVFEDPTGTLQRPSFLSGLRHDLISLLAMAGAAALILSASYWRWRSKQCTTVAQSQQRTWAMNQGGMPLNLEEGVGDTSRASYAASEGLPGAENFSQHDVMGSTSLPMVDPKHSRAHVTMREARPPREKKVKPDIIEFEGTVLEVLPGSTFRVELLDTGGQLNCTVNGRMRKNNIRIMVGDAVTVEISPYDLTKGRIVYRAKR